MTVLQTLAICKLTNLFPPYIINGQQMLNTINFQGQSGYLHLHQWHLRA
jgi:hypothetical protein